MGIYWSLDQRPTVNPRALIFDMDGVIVNSEPLHESAKRGALRSAGIEVGESDFAQYTGRSDRAMITDFATLTPDEHIDAAVQTLLRTSQGEFPVVDADHRLVGLLGRGQIIRALKELGPDAKVGQAMVTEIPTIESRRRLDEAFRLLQEKSAPAVGVVDAAGRLTGLVTSETIGRMLLVKDALPKGGRLGPWSRPAGA